MSIDSIFESLGCPGQSHRFDSPTHHLRVEFRARRPHGASHAQQGGCGAGGDLHGGSHGHIRDSDRAKVRDRRGLQVCWGASGPAFWQHDDIWWCWRRRREKYSTDETGGHERDDPVGFRAAGRSRCIRCRAEGAHGVPPALTHRRLPVFSEAYCSCGPCLMTTRRPSWSSRSPPQPRYVSRSSSERFCEYRGRRSCRWRCSSSPRARSSGTSSRSSSGCATFRATYVYTYDPASIFAGAIVGAAILNRLFNAAVSNTWRTTARCVTWPSSASTTTPHRLSTPLLANAALMLLTFLATYEAVKRVCNDHALNRGKGSEVEEEKSKKKNIIPRRTPGKELGGRWKALDGDGSRRAKAKTQSQMIRKKKKKETRKEPSRWKVSHGMAWHAPRSRP
ncbi:hypothetical protein MBM_06715 [Drepanopeziza brunnea f. sp. 'multigermtubi' MB_m1]|uniref:Uncharacterized protein n=1 Tax=Marssonina brunnea f. sp. multigermtubi (strain MB_m1) TaxID=1072389 RepID=K1XQS3_MARBU|nr:uncharacterized protein MBM_06715 [Drepanopeziza brunnea f. sp. 'multigermtubi' MB_m1]EKD14954.1 hypothetical protein MBM_06715 [Drepanopeziza brunnea f. sp. 'multigermtubi' MB_m1]